jgi:hypothetical protein
MSEITVDMMGDLRNKLLSEIKKADVTYRSGYVDGVLDMFNELARIKNDEPVKSSKQTAQIKV